MWCLLTRKEPFTEFSDYNIFVNAIVNGKVRPPIPDDCEPSLRDLIQACWHPEPSRRPSFADVLFSYLHYRYFTSSNQTPI